jgi:5-methylcytosine-specific restriction protein B
MGLSRVRLLQDYFEVARQSYPALSPLGFMRALYSEALGIAPVRVRDEAGDEEVDVEVEPEQVMAANPNPPLNQILYGPPGTGKTYATVDAALEILDPDFLRNYGADRLALKTRFDELHRQGRVRLVTFHQSFSYEDFVEGLRAETEDGQVQYSVVDGVFKELCQSAGAREVVSAESLVEVHGRRVWKMSLGNTGIDEAGIYEECIAGGYALLGYGGSINFSGCATKAELQARFEANGVTFEDAATDYTLTSVTAFVLKMKPGDLLVVTDGNTKFRAIGEVTGNYEFAQHQDYVGDFSQRRAVRWLRTYRPSLPFAELMNNRFSQMTLYELRPGSIDLEKLQGLLSVRGSVGDPKTAAQGRRVLIIDEINRGNVSRIFGELITLIEPSKRAGELEMLEATLPYSKDKFSIPNNVYLVGTMNTADRSLAGLDIALRRRFVFRELPPRPELLEGVVVAGVNVAGMLSAMNERIEALLGRDHCLGHAYFIPLQQEPTLDKLAGIFRNQILPLLQEYFFEDWQRIQWVLNDHRKSSEACKFITGVSLDSARLFGPDVNAGGQAVGWRVNPDAFGNIQSYRSILDASTAT